jgi:TPR repeat protein
MSQYKLGYCCENGFHGFAKDTKQAEEWYLRAAESGDAKAQLGLGRLYQNDEKSKDITKALEWYEKAYYNGEMKAAAEALCDIFDPDEESEFADLDKAIEWAFRCRKHNSAGYFLQKSDSPGTLSMIKGLYRSSVHALGDGPSFNNLGTECTEEFKTVLFRRSALLGCKSGQLHYADFLADNDPNKLKYLLSAAKCKSYPGPNAQWELGVMYEKGRCGLQLEKNDVLAKEWKDKALANGYKPPDSDDDDQDEDEDGEE